MDPEVVNAPSPNPENVVASVDDSNNEVSVAKPACSDPDDVKPRLFIFKKQTPGKLKRQANKAKTAKDFAIAEYFKCKKKGLQKKLQLLKLTNEKLKLEIVKLRIQLRMSEK